MYDVLSNETKEKLREFSKHENPYAFKDELAFRRKDNPHDRPNEIRSNFIRDIDKILNCPFFSRYQDKTQVFSLYRNDDITRRWLHVQFVSRIARTIGKALNLNLELIEAIALGHDIGHTPFGHAGERILNEISLETLSERFMHNVHSVRVLDKIFPYNVTMQTLDGILCHNGEKELPVYRPQPLNNFSEFDKMVDNCYIGGDIAKNTLPSTLEGCVVRIADIIAYIGKDRQDAEKTSSVAETDFFVTEIGSHNAEMINNLTVDIVENSLAQPYVKLSDEYFNALKIAKGENYNVIYFNDRAAKLGANLKEMTFMLFEKFLTDLKKSDRSSFIFRHHIDYINSMRLRRDEPYGNDKNERIVIDYLAAMTDDYFIDVFKNVFPDSKLDLPYKGYFD